MPVQSPWTMAQQVQSFTVVSIVSMKGGGSPSNHTWTCSNLFGDSNSNEKGKLDWETIIDNLFLDNPAMNIQRMTNLSSREVPK